MGKKILSVAGLMFIGVTAAVWGGDVLLSDPFSYSNGLITNEYAYWNPQDSSAARSNIWELNSGSLFAVNGAGWTGVPDNIGPNRTSSNGTNSAVFRMTTNRSDFKDVAVTFSLLNQGLSSTSSTPPVGWDGIHIWLRYQSEEHLYYASINRRDNKVVIKKKVPGGTSNGGTYYNLSSYLPFSVPYGSWQQVKAIARNNADGSVTIELYSGGTLLVKATDNGSVGGAPITAAGKVGIRGDNANLKFDDFTVTALSGGSGPSAPPAPAGVKAVPGDTTVTISWNPSPGAASYNLYRTRFPPATRERGFKVANVQSPYVNTGFTNGTEYFMVVTAVNEGGESVESGQVSAIPEAKQTLEPPPAPTNVKAVPGDTTVTISWDPVPGASSYNLYRSRFPPVTKTSGYRIAGVQSPTVNTGFDNGTEYFMVVTAVNAAGESVESAEVSATPKAMTPPSAPTGVKAVPGDSEVTVSWNPVPGADSYNVYRTRFPPSTKERGFKVENAQSPYVNAGFINGTEYYMVVTALNEAGESVESVQVSAIPKALEPPRAPTGVTVVPGDSQIIISWDPVPGADSYNLYRTRFPPCTITRGYKIERAENPYVNQGFTNGTEYFMVVTAVNAAGESVESVQLSAIPGTDTVAAQAKAAAVAAAPSVFVVRPNPWRSDTHNGLPITFDGIDVNDSIELFDAVGRSVHTLRATSNTVPWNLINESGEPVASGIYFYLITNGSGVEQRGKLGVIR